MGGRSKALLELDQRDTFLTRIIRAFHDAGVEDVVVVIGHDAAAVRASLVEHGIQLAPDPATDSHLRGVRVVVNPAYESGQLSSLLTGLDAIDRPGVHAVLMTLVDVPMVSASTIRRVIDRYHAAHAPVVRPVRGAEHGHPVLIDRTLFDQLRHADASAGAKPVIRAHASEAGNVPVDDDGAFFDVDTPADYARLRGKA